MSIFTLADLGEGLHEATIIEWYAQANSTLKQGELLLAVETAKAIVDIPAPEDLVIDELLVATNTVAKVGTPLIRYHSNTENSTSSAPSVSVVGTLIEASNSHRDQPFIFAKDRFSRQELAQSDIALKATPITHQMVTDVALSSHTIALSGSRLTMNQQLSFAHQQVALVTLFDEVRLTWSKKTRPLARLVRALCAGCVAEPKLNAWFKDDALIIHHHVDIGIAINTAHGLFVPVLAKANSLTLTEIETQLNSLKQQAHDHQLTSASLQGATISLSNFGMLAGRFATPMILPPQVAILGAGRIDTQRWLTKRGKLKQARLMPLSLSFDHRVLTGAEAALFLAAVMADLALKK